ncbi:hypothetical protein EON79_10495 [bacterium]|nr:MAG: hypothetical protein EON79_10495 [bacterium]
MELRELAEMKLGVRQIALIALLGAAGGAVVYFWPTGAVKVDWNQVLDATEAQTRVVLRSSAPMSEGAVFITPGASTKTVEGYMDGPKFAYESRNKESQKIFWTDGTQYQTFNGPSDVAWLYPGKNSEEGLLKSASTNNSGQSVLFGRNGWIEGNGTIHEIRPSRKHADNLIHSHFGWDDEVDENGQLPREIEVVTEPDTHRIRRIEFRMTNQAPAVTEFDYPASIPPDKLKPALPPGTKVMRADEAEPIVRKLFASSRNTQSIGDRKVTLLGHLNAGFQSYVFFRITGPKPTKAPTVSIVGQTYPLSSMGGRSSLGNPKKSPVSQDGLTYGYSYSNGETTKKRSVFKFGLGGKSLTFRALPATPIPNSGTMVDAFDFKLED